LGAPDPSITLPVSSNNIIGKESREETQSLQFPTVEPLSPTWELPLLVPTLVKLRAMQAMTPSQKLISLCTKTIANLPTHTSRISNSAGPPVVFHGRNDENAQNFLWATEMYILVNGIKDEAVKIELFGTLISAGSQADLWWTNLDTKHKASWSAVRAAFITKWPTIIAADKTKLEYQKELLVL
jgi:hypothetical protein